jgi:hypothetical protein
LDRIGHQSTTLNVGFATTHRHWQSQWHPADGVNHILSINFFY